MALQYEMVKCKGCETWFWKRFIENGNCSDCLKVSVTKQEITEQKTNEENKSDNGETKK